MWVVVAGNIISGVNKANIDLLEVVDWETYINIMHCVSSLIQAGLVALFAFTIECNLIMLGFVILVVETFLHFLILIPYLLWLFPPRRASLGHLC